MYLKPMNHRGEQHYSTIPSQNNIENSGMCIFTTCENIQFRFCNLG